MKLNLASQALLLTAFLAQQHGIVVHAACPFAHLFGSTTAQQTDEHQNPHHDIQMMNDPIFKSINTSLNREEVTNERRKLQASCGADFVFTTALYEQIETEVAEIAAGRNLNNGDRGRFFGGILRLAAHDFMDFNRLASPGEEGGSDGCLVFHEDDNKGLEAVWVADSQDTIHPVPLLQTLFEEMYEPMGMSRADYWVAIANAVVKISSPNQDYALPFRYGRLSNEDCGFSEGRQPKANGCSDIEEVFINRMGVTWRDATALMGGHTLGGGSADASGHEGIWDNTRAGSAEFNNDYYDELLNRAWRPRLNGANLAHDWTWAGPNNGNFPFLMLHTDVCLYFDIPEDGTAHCCTDIGGNCRDNEVQNIQCPTAQNVRPEAFTAVEEFSNSNNLGVRSEFDESTLGHRGLRKNGHGGNGGGGG